MTNHRPSRFDEMLEKWARRPPETPADEAARQVMAQLQERPARGWFSGKQLRFATAAAGLVLLLIVGWVTMPDPADISVSTREVTLPPLSEDVVLLWLDDKTPLYLTVAPPVTKGGS